MRPPRLLLPLLLAGTSFSPPARALEPPSVDMAIRTGERATRDAALVIGNESYAGLPQATYASADAHSFRDWLTYTRGVSKYRTTYIENADRNAIMKNVKATAKKVKPGGTAWIYYAGHGTVVEGGERALLGADANVSDLAGEGVRIGEIVEQFGGKKGADLVVLVLDASFGGVGRDGLELVPGAEVAVPEGFGDVDPRFVIWAATTDARPADTYALARHGLFTWTVLGALRGWADGEIDGQRDGVVNLGEAMAFAARATRHLGRVNVPARTPPAAKAPVPLAVGSGLEQAPSSDQFSLLAKQDIERRMAEAESRVKAEAAAFWQQTLKKLQSGGEGGRDALQAFIDEFSVAALSIEWSLQVPEVAEAQKVLARFDAGGVEAAVEVAQIEPCDDLVEMETAATLGKLTPGKRACLENRLQTERLQTQKNRVSRLLMVNAEAAGDTAEWERLVTRHLEEVDRSDPDLCFRYAIFLHKGALDDAEEAIRWADYALENKQVWVADEFVRKVYALYRLRAEAAQKLWSDAEARYREEAAPEFEAQAREYRGWTMDFSREWLDYARASGKPQDAALHMCTSAAGTVEFCREAPK